MINQFKALLKNHSLIPLDGGLATELESRGHNLNSTLWSAQLLLNDPGEIFDSHIAYLRAGARIITTASYQATIPGLIEAGLSYNEAVAIINSSVDIACKARDSYAKETGSSGTLIAASIGPYGAYLADGSEYQGQYGLSVSELENFHRERLTILDASPADVLACETIPDATEARALNNLLQQCDTPSWVCFSCKDSLHLHDGTSIEEAAAIFKNNLKVMALGINCTSPRHVSGLIQALIQADIGKAIIVYPNSGEDYCGHNKTWTNKDNPEIGNRDFSEFAIQWAKQGAQIIGGCCRTGPDDISSLADHATALSRPGN